MGGWTATQTTKEPITSGLNRFNQTMQGTMQNIMNTLLTMHQIKQQEQQAQEHSEQQGILKVGQASKLFEEYGGEATYNQLRDIVKNTHGIDLPKVEEVKANIQKLTQPVPEEQTVQTEEEQLVGTPRKFSEILKDKIQSYGTELLTPKQLAEARKSAHAEFTQELKTHELTKRELMREKAAEKRQAAKQEAIDLRADKRAEQQMEILDKKFEQQLELMDKKLASQEKIANSKESRKEILDSRKEIKELSKKQDAIKKEYRTKANKLYADYMKGFTSGDFTTEQYKAELDNLYNQYGAAYEELGLPVNWKTPSSTGTVSLSSSKTIAPPNAIEGLKDYARKGDKQAQSYLKSQGIKWQQ